MNVIKTALKLLPRKIREPEVAQPQSVSRPSRVSSVSTDVTLCDNQPAAELEGASRNLLHFLQLPIGTEMHQGNCQRNPVVDPESGCMASTVSLL